MSIADKALWVIERNSDRALSMSKIAQACGVSRSHLANAFGSATGLSVMKYLRSRRLTEAARTLANGAPDILTVALDAGYGSHEAFTRAFGDQFGVTPESVRERGSIDALALTLPLELKAHSTSLPERPSIENLGHLRVVGLSDRCSFDTLINIPAQWQRFMGSYDDIPSKLDAIPIGLNYPSDGDGFFDYICAAEVSEFGRTPNELVQLTIEPRRYAVFKHTPHVSKIFETYSAIWNDALSSNDLSVADAPVIERHNSSFDPRTGEGGLTLWIPLSS